jgi:hypothetical protein
VCEGELGCTGFVHNFYYLIKGKKIDPVIHDLVEAWWKY